MKVVAKAAHSASSLSCRQALNLTISGGVRGRPRAPSATSSCCMNDDLPLPQGPSIEMVSGGRVASLSRKRSTASTSGLKPSTSWSAGRSLTAATWMESAVAAGAALGSVAPGDTLSGLSAISPSRRGWQLGGGWSICGSRRHGSTRRWTPGWRSGATTAGYRVPRSHSPDDPDDPHDGAGDQQKERPGHLIVEGSPALHTATRLQPRRSMRPAGKTRSGSSHDPLSRSCACETGAHTFYHREGRAPA